MAILVRSIAIATLLFSFQAGTQLRAAPRSASDPACQITVQWRGKPPMREGPMVWGPGRPGKPISYRDPVTKILFYVESDGRHLAAVGPDDKLLWVRNPFDDKGLCPYRSARPVISSMKAFEMQPAHAKNVAKYMKYRGANPGHRFLRIEFDSSQFGEVDETTGDFLYEGQN